MSEKKEQYLKQFLRYKETLKLDEEISISRADYHILSAVKDTNGEYLLKVPTILRALPNYKQTLEECKNLFYPNLLGIRILFSDNPKFKLKTYEKKFMETFKKRAKKANCTILLNTQHNSDILKTQMQEV